MSGMASTRFEQSSNLQMLRNAQYLLIQLVTFCSDASGHLAPLSRLLQQAILPDVYTQGMLFAHLFLLGIVSRCQLNFVFIKVAVFTLLISCGDILFVAFTGLVSSGAISPPFCTKTRMSSSQQSEFYSQSTHFYCYFKDGIYFSDRTIGLRNHFHFPLIENRNIAPVTKGPTFSPRQFHER